MTRLGRRSSLVLGTVVLVLAALVAPTAQARNAPSDRDQTLTPRTSFTMAADGSSGLTQGGAGIPNIDSDKKTIAAYYGDPGYYGAPGAGIADKITSPYITEMAAIQANQWHQLRKAYAKAIREGKRPAIVFDADDTTLWTYDMEVAEMHFIFDPVLQNVWVQDQRFPATPGMVDFVNRAKAMGFAIFGLTGRNDGQKAATLGNLTKVGYTPFTDDNFFTKYLTGTTPPAWLPPTWCTAYPVCNTVEYKAGTRRHIEQDLGYDIVLNVGDQWSDLMGGYADRTLKLPNPTYYLPSPNLPGVSEPDLAPRTHFTMKADGSSGLTVPGEGIPNVDVVKSTIRKYYNATAGIADKTTSPYITEVGALVDKVGPGVLSECQRRSAKGQHPAVVFDADDTTLWTYDMEDGRMGFYFQPTVQNDEWVQPQKFPATPAMVPFVNAVGAAGCTVVGLTGRNNSQRDATIGNLAKVGYTVFTPEHYYTKWTSTDPIPDWYHCVLAPRCTTIEYKSQTRALVESQGYDIIANFGDQFSDLIGGHANRVVKLPNPTYYLP